MSADLVESKGEFAERCGVSPGRVTQWIKEGKITVDALVGEGRSSKILVDKALQQVNLRRDVGQALGNGIATKLAPSRTVHEDQDGGSFEGLVDDIDRKLKLSKLEASERSNRMAALEEAAAAGTYTETASARAELSNIAGQMIRTFEGALPELASAIAGKFELETRDVGHFLTEHFRKIREQAAEVAATAAAALSETIVQA